MSSPDTDQKSLADNNMLNEGYRNTTNLTNEMIKLLSNLKDEQRPA